jgi:hypothetical protein
LGSFDPESPLVMTTETISQPAFAHLASVPATVNSWSSGWRNAHAVWDEFIVMKVILPINIYKPEL